MGEHTAKTRHPSRRDRSRQLLERFELKFYVAPHRMTEIATERTQDMADYFIVNSRDRNYYVDDVRCLVRSAYMQGIHDILDVIASGQVEELVKSASPGRDSQDGKVEE